MRRRWGCRGRNERALDAKRSRHDELAGAEWYGEARDVGGGEAGHSVGSLTPLVRLAGGELDALADGPGGVEVTEEGMLVLPRSDLIHRVDDLQTEEPAITEGEACLEALT